MASWPSSLPQKPLRGVSETRESNVIRSPVELGPAKLRRRYTVDIILFSVTLPMTKSEVDTFNAFYETTIDHGSLAFDWIHPRTEVANVFRLRTAPSYTTLGKDNYQISFEMELIP